MELFEHLRGEKPFHTAKRKEALRELIRSNFSEIMQAKERGYSWSQLYHGMRQMWPDVCVFGKGTQIQRIYHEIRKEKTMLNNNRNIAITTFTYGDNPVRTIEIDNEIRFVGKDVAEILGYKDTVNALKDHVDEEDKMGWRIATPSRGEQETTIINESGLYSLILSSKLPTAKKFKHWVTSEVLPSIRKTGNYSVNQMSNEEIQFRTKELEARNRELDMRGAEIIQKMLDKPPFPITPETRTIFANEVFRLSSGHDCLAMLPECTDKWYTATEIGKLLGITPNKVGRIATANNLKAPEGGSNEYGRWIFSKSKYSNREVPSFIYNDNGLDWFKTHQVH